MQRKDEVTERLTRPHPLLADLSATSSRLSMADQSASNTEAFRCEEATVLGIRDLPDLAQDGRGQGRVLEEGHSEVTSCGARGSESVSACYYACIEGTH